MKADGGGIGPPPPPSGSYAGPGPVGPRQLPTFPDPAAPPPGQRAHGAPSYWPSGRPMRGSALPEVDSAGGNPSGPWRPGPSAGFSLCRGSLRSS